MEKNFVKKGLTNIKYVLTSQLVYYILSFIASFVLPGILGVSSYGYYSLYLLYTSYVGMLHFGFNDGIYLKYGGCDYNQLPSELFRSFSRFYALFTSAEILLFSLLLLLEPDPNKKFAIFFAILNVMVVNISKMFNNINQVTNRMKIYSFVVVAENLQIIVAIGLLVALRQCFFRQVIVCDFLAKVVVLLINLFCDRSIVFGKSIPLRPALGDCLDNFRVGVKVMVSAVMGMLILDIGNFILSFGKVSNFSLYSFACNSTNIAMMFISAVSLVLYPILCRLNRETLPKYFEFINRMLCAVIFCMMILYYPLVVAIRLFLPKYLPVTGYLYLLFPCVIMQSKMQLLINNYYKSLREEKSMMIANLTSLAVFVLIAVPLFSFYGSIQVIVWATLLTFTWRCYASEIYLKRVMKIGNYRNIIEEISMAVIFVVTAGLIKGLAGMLIYAAFAAAYLFINRKEIFKYIQSFIRKAFEKPSVQNE